MKADLIIVSHNSKEDLERFLPSIEENTDDFSLVIIDNESEVETRKYLENCGKKVIFQKNKGYGAACNVGAKATDSEFVVFLNSDLLARKDWLIDLLKPFEDSTVAVTGARLFASDGFEYPTPKEGMAIGCCFAVRRKVFDELGGFDENFFLFFEETDFCKRAITAGYRVIRSEARLIHYHPSFPPFSDKLQKIWDRSAEYFRNKHAICQKKQNIALVMIVKNEEKGLERAILSCRDFVSEIVIAVDNSSTDKTEEIAKKYATTLKHFDWQDDFSKARNFAHEGVKTDWILFLDGHEYVSAAPDLETHLATKHDGIMCAIEMESGMIFGNPRIYRNGVHFEGQVHEHQTCQSVESYPEFLIKHDRVGGQDITAMKEREKQRNDQVPRIMGGLYKKDKENTRAAFHLALFSETNGDVKSAIRWWGRFLRYAKDRGERWYAFFELSRCHLTLGHSFRAYWYASRSDDETPGRWETSKLKGLILFQQRKFAKAAECFVGGLSNNDCIVHYRPWSRDVSGTFNLIGECLFNLDVLDKASLAFGRAAETCTDREFKKVLEGRAKLMEDIFKDRLTRSDIK